jgi:hypothetical protein
MAGDHFFLKLMIFMKSAIGHFFFAAGTFSSESTMQYSPGTWRFAQF